MRNVIELYDLWINNSYIQGENLLNYFKLGKFYHFIAEIKTNLNVKIKDIFVGTDQCIKSFHRCLQIIKCLFLFFYF